MAERELTVTIRARDLASEGLLGLGERLEAVAQSVETLSARYEGMASAFRTQTMDVAAPALTELATEAAAAATHLAERFFDPVQARVRSLDAAWRALAGSVRAIREEASSAGAVPGALPRFEIGGIVGRLGLDTVPILAHVGEGVLTREGVEAVGGPIGVARLNAGAPLPAREAGPYPLAPPPAELPLPARGEGPGVGSSIQITIQALDGPSVERVVRSQVVPLLRELSEAGEDIVFARGVRSMASVE